MQEFKDYFYSHWSKPREISSVYIDYSIGEYRDYCSYYITIKYNSDCDSSDINYEVDKCKRVLYDALRYVRERSPLGSLVSEDASYDIEEIKVESDYDDWD